MSNDTFAKRLKYAMHKNKLTLSELSNITGISKPLISNYLSGNYNAKQQNIYRISEALKVSPTWLMGYNVPIDKFEQSTNDILYDSLIKTDINILELSLVTGINEKDIKNIINGTEKLPKPSHLKKLADILKIDFLQLLISAGYIENYENLNENNAYNSGIRFLLDENERKIICSYLLNNWEKKYKKKFSYNEIYNKIFGGEKHNFTKKEVLDIVNYNNNNENFINYFSNNNQAILELIKLLITANEFDEKTIKKISNLRNAIVHNINIKNNNNL